MSMSVRKLTSEQRLSRAIDIMEALYAVGEKGMERSEICSRFDITSASLDEIIGIISTLADRESGARVICECRDERVILTGGAVCCRCVSVRPRAPYSTMNLSR